MLVLGKQPDKSLLEKDEFNIDWMLQGPEVTPEMKKDILASLEDYGFKIPKDIVSYIIAHYNYVPYSKNKFDVKDHKCIQFKYFLNFENPMYLTPKESAYHLYQFYCNGENSESGISPFEVSELYPIACTVNDALICADSKGAIHLYYLDSDEVIKAANTLDEFLSNFYINEDC